MSEIETKWRVRIQLFQPHVVESLSENVYTYPNEADAIEASLRACETAEQDSEGAE